MLGWVLNFDTILSISSAYSLPVLKDIHTGQGNQLLVRNNC